MSTPIEKWVADVAGHTAPTRVEWLNANSVPPSGEVRTEKHSSDGEPVKPPTTLMCGRRREDIPLHCEFISPVDATARYWPAFHNSMQGRVMYVVPYVLGRGSPEASFGAQITDDLQLAVALARTVHIDRPEPQSMHFVRSLHAQRANCPAPVICCFTESRTIWAPSVSAGDFLDARTHALRLMTTEIADDDRRGRLPARMAVVAVETEGRDRPIHYGVIASVELGQSPHILMGSTKRGRASHRVLSSQVAWLVAENGRLNALLCEKPPARSAFEGTTEVPLDAIVFSTRRASSVPVVLEVPTWPRACHAGALLAAGVDEDGRFIDPMGMRAFSGIDLNAYLDRWLALGSRLRHPPKVFQLNWFRRGRDGSLLWPALFESWRIIDWMNARVLDQAVAHSTPMGLVPPVEAIDRSGLQLTDAQWRELTELDVSTLRRDFNVYDRAFERLGGGIPLEIHREHRLLRTRLSQRVNDHE